MKKNTKVYKYSYPQRSTQKRKTNMPHPNRGKDCKGPRGMDAWSWDKRPSRIDQLAQRKGKTQINKGWCKISIINKRLGRIMNENGEKKDEQNKKKMNKQAK